MNGVCRKCSCSRYKKINFFTPRIVYQGILRLMLAAVGHRAVVDDDDNANDDDANGDDDDDDIFIHILQICVPLLVCVISTTHKVAKTFQPHFRLSHENMYLLSPRPWHFK